MPENPLLIVGNLKDIKDKAAIHTIARCTLGMGLGLDMKLGWMDSACGVISCQKAADTTLCKNPIIGVRYIYYQSGVVVMHHKRNHPGIVL